MRPPGTGQRWKSGARRALSARVIPSSAIQTSFQHSTALNPECRIPNPVPTLQARYNRIRYDIVYSIS